MSMDEFTSEDIEYNYTSSNEQESEKEHFCENIRKRKNAVDTCADKVVEDAKNKRKAVAKPHGKRSVTRSHLQAMSQLAASVNSLAKVNARKMMIEEKDRKSLLEFRREEAEKTRQHEKCMVEHYLRILNHSNSSNPNPFVHKQLSSSSIFPSEFTPPMTSSTPPFLPVTRIGALSNRFQSSSTQPLDGKTHTFQFPQINNK